ncbi:MAG: ABC transporter permease [Cyclobacteriaceae bacterium]
MPSGLITSATLHSLHHKETDKIILTEEIRWAEPGFESVLAFDLLKGNQEKMFQDHNSILLSEEGARKLFGSADPIGQIISVKHNWATQGREIDVAVTGIYRDYPSNSHFKPQYILNVNALRNIHDDFNTYMEGSGFQNSNFFENYVVVKPDADIGEIQKSLKVWGDQMAQADSGFVAGGWKIDPFLTKLSALHFD